MGRQTEMCPYDEFDKQVTERTITPISAYDLYQKAHFSGDNWGAWRISMSITSHNGNELLELIFNSDPTAWEDREALSLSKQGITHSNGNGHR